MEPSGSTGPAPGADSSGGPTWGRVAAQGDTTNYGVLGGILGFTSNVPMWYRSQGELAQSEANQRALTEALRSQKNQIQAQVDDAYRQVVVAENEIRLYQQSLLPDAKRLVDQTLIRYRHGDASGQDVLQVQKAYRDAEGAYNQAYHAYNDALATLEVAAATDITSLRGTRP